MDPNVSAAAILGGGPSLPSDLRRLPSGCMLIAVNDHAFHHCAPDYLVYMDKPEEFPQLVDVMRSFKGIKVSPHASSDITLPKGEWWDGGFTSTLATWFACWIGAKPVILCGMDCYQGEEKYCHSRPGFYHPVFDFPLENHLRAWRFALKKCPNSQVIRAMSGPLVEVFGQYEPG
jgi:hypothetical protein